MIVVGNVHVFRSLSRLAGIQSNRILVLGAGKLGWLGYGVRGDVAVFGDVFEAYRYTFRNA